VTALDDDLRARIRARPFWYHTMDLAPDHTVEGIFDLRGMVDDLPWPDVRGKRCLDVGTYDGFLAFELERRGASEVVAVDIAGPELLDWSYGLRPGVAPVSVKDRDFFEPAHGAGFALAAEALGSAVSWRPISIYDLNPDDVGTFDFVICSSLLLHLRDPIRALEAVRSVCGGTFLTFEPIDLWLTLLHRRRAAVRFEGQGWDCTWWVPNGAAQVRMLQSAGFRVDLVDRPRVIPATRHYKFQPRTVSRVIENTISRVATRSMKLGSTQRAIVASPVDLHASS
jgi:tRNA (mo5U34)-methyltransferase